MTTLELYRALGELLNADPAAGAREVLVDDQSSYRTYAVVSVEAPPADAPAPRGVLLDVEEFAEARCSCGGTITYLASRPTGSRMELCDSCDEPTPVCPSSEEEQRQVLAEVEAATREATSQRLVLCTRDGRTTHEETAGGLTACGLQIDYRWTTFMVRPGAEVQAPTCASCRRVRERAAAYLAAMAGGGAR